MSVVVPPRSRRARRALARVQAELAEMATLVSTPALLDLRAPAVSRWSAGEQLEHLVLIDRGVLETIRRLDAGEVDKGGGPTWIGRLVLALRFIPRGGAKAPEAFLPRGVDPAELVAAVGELELGFRRLEPEVDRLASLRATSRHPILGRFTVLRWLRFVHVHHRHHLRIVADIRRKARA